jgi:hypothetical protein
LSFLASVLLFHCFASSCLVLASACPRPCHCPFAVHLFYDNNKTTQDKDKARTKRRRISRTTRQHQEKTRLNKTTPTRYETRRHAGRWMAQAKEKGAKMRIFGCLFCFCFFICLPKMTSTRPDQDAYMQAMGNTRKERHEDSTDRQRSLLCLWVCLGLYSNVVPLHGLILPRLLMTLLILSCFILSLCLLCFDFYV